MGLWAHYSSLHRSRLGERNLRHTMTALMCQLVGLAPPSLENQCPEWEQSRYDVLSRKDWLLQNICNMINILHQTPKRNLRLTQGPYPYRRL